MQGYLSQVGCVLAHSFVSALFLEKVYPTFTMADSYINSG